VTRGLDQALNFACSAIATVTSALLLAAIATAGDPPPVVERVHARAAVPDEARKIGEVRLIERGSTTVVQTVLATRVIARAVAEIRQKEERDWPLDRDGHSDMRRYVDALEQATAILKQELPPADARSIDDPERRVRLLIELRADSSSTELVIAEFQARDASTPYEPTVSRVLATLSPSRAYVLENMRLILADAFQLPEADLGRLGPLGPLAPS
jgi:hypothetical protein